MRKLLFPMILSTYLLGIVSPAIAQQASKSPKNVDSTKENQELVGMWQRIVAVANKSSSNQEDKDNKESYRLLYISTFKQINADHTFLNVTQNPQTLRMYGSVKGKWSADKARKTYKEEIKTHFLDETLEGSIVSMDFELSEDGSLLYLILTYPDGVKSTEMWKRIDLDQEIRNELVSTTQRGIKKHKI